MCEAPKAFYGSGDAAGLDGYSKKALAGIWTAMRFSGSSTKMTHRFLDRNAYERRMQDTELAYLHNSRAAQKAMAENYTGLPFEDVG